MLVAEKNSHAFTFVMFSLFVSAKANTYLYKNIHRMERLSKMRPDRMKAEHADDL